jgi:DnaK suppressor protein
MTGTMTFPATAPCPLDRGQVARLRFVLTDQRRFRLEQLAELERRRTVRNDAAAEVARSLVTGARAALTDICDALRQIDGGRYGWCRDCGAALPVERLDLLPHVTRCPDCVRIPYPRRA